MARSGRRAPILPRVTDHEYEAINLAVFFDLENVVRSGEKSFSVDAVLQRLLDKGNVIVRKAYADWERFGDFKRPFHQAAVELIDIPSSKMSGKNSADIKMVVDALELAFTKRHIDTFALVSGDSDFSPLVSKLRENGRYVIGVGVKESSSSLLIDNCDEFIFYEDIVGKKKKRASKALKGVSDDQAEAFRHLLDAASGMLRDGKTLYSSAVKQAIKRKQPQFNEEYHGYSSFSRLLEDAESCGLIRLRRDGRSGTYVIEEMFDD